MNSLLKDVIGDLSAGFDYVLIDGEAGVEQINRRVMKQVNHLIIVSDASAKGINVARTISRVAGGNRAVDFLTMGLVLNRVRGEEEVREIGRGIDLDIYGWIPEDGRIREYDHQGRPLLDMPEDSPADRVVKKLAMKFVH